jgi:CRP-like cAMP-binding protein
LEIEKTLKRAELFLGLDDADLLRIARLPSSHEVAYSPGDVIIEDEGIAKYLYVLRKGQVDLVMEVPPMFGQEGAVVVVDRVTTGGCFGWSALVRPHLYVMSAVCRESAYAVAISGAELMALFEEDHRIGYRIFQSLAHIIGARLRDVEQALVKDQRWPFPG